MKTTEHWEAVEAEIKELEELRRGISERIHLLRVSLNQHRKQNPPSKTDTIAYQMFGKRLKDLTADEYRQYYNARQKINRAKRKEKSQ